MPLDVLAALSVFALVSSFTPGPNNMMLLASGVNFGFRRTVPHMLGIAVGFASLLLAVGLGLGTLLSAFPMLHLALKIAGGAYLLYLAWRIATSRAVGETDGSARPLSFGQAFAFQWVNPKAWVMGTTAMAIYTSPDAPVLSVILVAGIFCLVGVPSVSVWAGFGVALRDLLADPVCLRWFNIAMGVLLAASLWPMLA